MPLLIDGNNLAHAMGTELAPIGRDALCEMLSRLAARGEQICVVFDGRVPPDPQVAQLEQYDVEVVFSGRKKADQLVVERIAANTAPRRLVVVSSDREIRRAARRRRCRGMTSDQFADVLFRAARNDRTRPPSEPPEKRRGLTPEQTKAWLREFKLDDPDERNS